MMPQKYAHVSWPVWIGGADIQFDGNDRRQRPRCGRSFDAKGLRSFNDTGGLHCANLCLRKEK